VKFIQIPEEYSTTGFYILMKDGTDFGDVKCLPQNVYGVNENQLNLLVHRGILFSEVDPEEIEMITPSIYK